DLPDPRHRACAHYTAGPPPGSRLVMPPFQSATHDAAVRSLAAGPDRRWNAGDPSALRTAEAPVARRPGDERGRGMTLRSWRSGFTWLGARRLMAAAGSALVILGAWPAHAQSPAAAPKAYVGLFKDNAVAVIDTATPRVLGTIPVPAGPHGLVLTPDGRKAYVSSDG